MKISIIKKSTLTPSIWDGGKTYEYCIYPTSSSYSERNFDFRISCAAIEKAPSDFTRFEGYQRYLVMLDGDLSIIRNGVEEKYAQHEIFTFNSNDEIQSFSLGNDFNLMHTNSIKNSEVYLSIVDGTLNAKFMLFFALTSSTLWVNNKEYNLQSNDLLFIDNNQRDTFTLKSTNTLINCLIK